MSAVLIRVAVYQDPPSWCAHALECDVAVTAPTADVALDALLKLLHAQMTHDRRHRRPPWSSCSAAPRRVWDIYSAAVTKRAPRTINKVYRESVLQIRVATAREPSPDAVVTLA